MQRVGVSKPKCWYADTLKEKGGTVETNSKYCCKILEIINKLINFFQEFFLIQNFKTKVSFFTKNILWILNFFWNQIFFKGTKKNWDPKLYQTIVFYPQFCYSYIFSTDFFMLAQQQKQNKLRVSWAKLSLAYASYPLASG